MCSDPGLPKQESKYCLQTSILYGAYTTVGHFMIDDVRSPELTEVENTYKFGSKFPEKRAKIYKPSNCIYRNLLKTIKTYCNCYPSYIGKNLILSRCFLLTTSWDLEIHKSSWVNIFERQCKRSCQHNESSRMQFLFAWSLYFIPFQSIQGRLFHFKS